MNSHLQKQPQQKSQHGFSLIEVMVALLIFSIGLMGLAGLQMEGMNSNYDAMMRTIATQHAYNMADTIRSSRGGYMTNPGGGAGGCAACPQDIQDDFVTWSNLVQSSLPSGNGTVTDLAGGMVDIVIRWDEQGTGATGRTCPPPPFSNNLQCVRIRIIP